MGKCKRNCHKQNRDIPEEHVHLGEVEDNDEKKRKGSGNAWPEDVPAGEDPQRDDDFNSAKEVEEQ
ncbi:hypothetical protein A3D62_00770 [Candidatus Kaiserbacteria bacterium RIFCSPHIGHO2_02_FULL_49_11]|uniref:Uncharacterized protein n=1 Tax=Candidatus Kaiserbacteria bacterium RIFCSPHIGHO2_02_FULL_49_11 TaxID=1798489 RepID=A0A1F6D0Y1_9BACT|nr:MAG: hypothetical protein A3D62_00770 [Candidatus Kaiserbacteria bacterium RIFCSPHIGHO2_02_FULL_49_11]